MPRYDYKEEFDGRRVEESDSDASSYDSDEYLPVNLQKKKVSDPGPSTSKKSTPTIHTFPVLEHKTKKEPKEDSFDIFLKSIKEPKEEAILRENKSLIIHYDCAPKALEAIKALKTRDMILKFMNQTFYDLLEKEKNLKPEK